MTALPPEAEPHASSPQTLDELATLLADTRRRAGSPSFTEITRRVTAIRADRGDHPRELSVGRMTVYDCFRPGRRRIDAPLVLDIVRALGADEASLTLWAEWCARFSGTGPSAPLSARRGFPQPAESFIGSLESVDVALRAARPVLIVGMPGSGKSELLARVLDGLRVEGRVREAVSLDLRVEAPRGPIEVRDIVDALARALGRTANARADLDEALSSLDAAAAEVGAAIAIENVTDIASVEPLFGAVSVPLVVVCRSRVPRRPDATVLETVPWTIDEAAEFLRGHLDRDALDPQEAEALRGLAAETGGLPLAAQVLVAHIRRRTAWRLADHLDELREHRGQLAGPLESSIGLTYAALDAEVRRTLRMIACVPCSTIGVDELCALVDVDAATAGARLAALRSAHLVEDIAGDVRIHPVVRSFASRRARQEDAPAERQSALDRLVDHLLERAWQALACQYPAALGRTRRVGDPIPSSTPDIAAAFWTSRLPILLELAPAIAARRPLVLVEVSEVVSHHLDVDGQHRVAEEVHRTALHSAERTGDIDAIAVCAHHLSQSLVRLGSPYARSEVMRALHLAEQAGADALALKASNTLAILAAHEGDADEAVARFTAARRAAERAGLIDMLPALHDNTGVMLRRAGDLDGACSEHRRASQLATERGDEVMAAVALGNLCDAEMARGDFAAAVDFGREAVRLSRGRAGLAHAYALTNLGLALAGTGRADDGEDLLREASRLADEIGEAALLAAVHNGTGAVLLRARKTEAAREAFTHALARAEHSRIVHEQVRALTGLAECDIAQGEQERAREALDHAAGLAGTGPAPEAVRVAELRRSLTL